MRKVKHFDVDDCTIKVYNIYVCQVGAVNPRKDHVYVCKDNIGG